MPFHAKIRDGIIEFPSSAAAMKFQEWKRAHDGARLVIDEDKPTRSHSQNAYYWTYLGIIEKETGEAATDLHEFFKRKLLPPVFKTIRGEDMKLPASTTDLDKVAFGEYLDRICALTNIPLPDPEAAGYITNY